MRSFGGDKLGMKEKFIGEVGISCQPQRKMVEWAFEILEHLI